MRENPPSRPSHQLSQTFWYGRVRPLAVFCALFVIIAIGSMMISSERKKVEALEYSVRELELARDQLEKERKKLAYEIQIADTDEYIIAKAREYGYMMPGELLFVIKNPQALEDGSETIEMYVVESAI